MSERLQKWLAGQGLGSRRQMESWIVDGRITVDGQPAVLGQKVSGRERIKVDGKLLRVSSNRAPRPKTIMYHKPAGEICTRSDPQGRPTVFDHLPHLSRGRWIGVGRLDYQTSGLLLFTTDGELANRLMHPSSELIREYSVRVLGEIGPAAAKKLRRGIEFEEGPARFETLEFAGGGGAESLVSGERGRGTQSCGAASYRSSRVSRQPLDPDSFRAHQPAASIAGR